MSYQSCIDGLNAIKSSITNGKNLIGNVVGGNQDSTFQVLATSAQTLKNDRDNKLSQVNNLNSQVSSLTSQLTAITNDRNNWVNIANSKIDKVSGILNQNETASFKMPINNKCRVVAHHIGVYPSFSIYHVDYISGKYYLYCDKLSSSSGEYKDRMLGDCYYSSYTINLANHSDYSILKGTIDVVLNDGLYFNVINTGSSQIKYCMYSG